jgi:predicted transposase YbfD/YdcC
MAIGSLIRIDSTRNIKGEISQETRYYIASNKDITAKTALRQVRNHWSIENSLHWVLDMSFNEDMSRIRKENAPQIMAIIRHMALNLLQKTKKSMKRQSIKRLRKKAGWDNRTLIQLINKYFFMRWPCTPGPPHEKIFVYCLLSRTKNLKSKYA